MDYTWNTKYYYTIDRWVHLKYVRLACGYDQDYTYPDYVCAENERVHNVKYEYLVRFECEESHISRMVDKDTWESLHVGQEMSVEKNQYGIIIHVDWDNINKTNDWRRMFVYKPKVEANKKCTKSTTNMIKFVNFKTFLKDTENFRVF